MNNKNNRSLQSVFDEMDTITDNFTKSIPKTTKSTNKDRPVKELLNDYFKLPKEKQNNPLLISLLLKLLDE